MEVIQIIIPHGVMCIRPNGFFPATQAQLRKLLKIMRADEVHWRENTQKCMQYINNRCESLEKTEKEQAQDYLKFKQEEAKFRGIIDSCKYPNSVKLSREVLRDYIQRRNNAHKSWQAAEKSVERCRKEKVQLLRNFWLILDTRESYFAL